MKVFIIATWLHLIHYSRRVGRMHFICDLCVWNFIIIDKLAYLLEWTNLMFSGQLAFSDTNGQTSLTYLFCQGQLFQEGSAQYRTDLVEHKLFWAVLSLGNYSLQ